MSKVIKNSETEVPCGMCMNDKDYMNSILSSLKEMSKNYVVALTEASNEVLFKKLKKNFDKIIDAQRAVYEVMFENGWYMLEEADKTKVNEKYKMLCRELSELGEEE